MARQKLGNGQWREVGTSAPALPFQRYDGTVVDIGTVAPVSTPSGINPYRRGGGSKPCPWPGCTHRRSPRLPYCKEHLEMEDKEATLLPSEPEIAATDYIVPNQPETANGEEEESELGMAMWTAAVITDLETLTQEVGRLKDALETQPALPEEVTRGLQRIEEVAKAVADMEKANDARPEFWDAAIGQWVMERTVDAQGVHPWVIGQLIWLEQHGKKWERYQFENFTRMLVDAIEMIYPPDDGPVTD